MELVQGLFSLVDKYGVCLVVLGVVLWRFDSTLRDMEKTLIEIRDAVVRTTSLS